MINERIFISDAAGVIESKMVPRLIELGAQVFVGDLKPKPKFFPAEGMIRLAESSELKGVVNLGAGKVRRVSDIIEVIKSNIPNTNIETEDSVTDIEYEKRKLSGKKQYSCQNVLITSAGRKIPLINSVVDGVKRLNSKNRVYVTDINSKVHSQYVSDGFIQLPATDPINIDAIIKICCEFNINMIIPTRDGELLFWAKNQDKFKQDGIDIVISGAEAVSTCIDKLAFAIFGIDMKLPIIPAWESPQGNGPFVVKERFGAGSRSIGLNLSQEQAIQHGKNLDHPIFQPYITGQEISVDAWIDRNHKVKGLILRLRNEIINGESVVTTTFRNQDLEKQCIKILEALPLKGPVVIQILIDKSGYPHIIELNTRFGGASTASIAAGLDIWYWTLLEANGENLKNYPFHRCVQDIRQIRVPKDLVIYGSDF
ncbi:carbamoyl-phosphate synthase large subunit [Desulfobotulus alkaliphilus]|uniref:Carbamoyl-phosphate synthase large subunit n=1 Tax=Desulfobotulus alkaliphilus TaxID=622671 RepID=A0A562RTF0_9BACT|nr:ATP-grasp domain-containing protein [Desulfobotulus alkaliphilus]TWI72371.1 carbamoyl-phosphate synthase large subunit [Desulfobotulus alkaliphilus]